MKTYYRQRRMMKSLPQYNTYNDAELGETDQEIHVIEFRLEATEAISD